MSTSASPQPAEESSSKKGCLIGCLVVLVLFFVGCGGACMYAKGHIGTLTAIPFSKMQPQLEQMIEEDVDPELAATFQDEFGHFIEQIRSIDDMIDGDADAQNKSQKILAFTGRFGEYMQDEKLSQAEIEDFIDGVRALRGVETEEVSEETSQTSTSDE